MPDLTPGDVHVSQPLTAYERRQRDRAARQRAMTTIVKGFESGEHPRHPAGSPKGGEFMPKAGGEAPSADDLFYNEVKADREFDGLTTPLYRRGVLGKRVKVITGHQWLHELDDDAEPIGAVLRRGVPGTPQSPYDYSPTWTVYKRKGQPVIVVESGQRRREVFAITLRD